MENRFQLYPVAMPKRKPLLPLEGETFGQRLARLRKAAGYTQHTLAQAMSISHRMVAYYEVQTAHPPTHLLPKLAQVLGVSADQLLGIEKVKVLKQKDSRLRRLLEKVEGLPSSRRKQVAQLMQDILKASKGESEGKS
jgi:transcriptional regulator with XRE-family HTH domain